MSTYLNQPIRFGLQGLVLKRTRDVVDPDQAIVYTNLYNVAGGKAIVRPGETFFFQSGGHGRVHTLKRMNRQVTSSFTRYYGMDTVLQVGTTGSATTVSSGYSGNPLTLVPYVDEFGQDGWLYVGDQLKMNKVRWDGLVMPIGLPAPLTVPIATPLAVQRVQVDPLNATAGWVGRIGIGAPSVPTIDLSAPATPVGGGAVTMTTVPGSISGTYTSWMDKAISANLTFLGSNNATNNDYMHLWLWADFPSLISEIRVYLVTSPVFTPGVLPGTSSTQNNQGYWKSFSPSTLSTALAGAPIGNQLTLAEIQAINANLRQLAGNNPGGATQISATGPNVLSASGTWTEFGSVGIPLYRGDFTPFGQTVPITVPAPDGSWGTVTGIAIWVDVLAPVVTGSFSPAVKIAVSDLYLFGGYGLDDGAPGSIPYSWVYTNYDPRTGAESNLVGTVAVPTPSKPSLDVLRGAVSVQPAAYGNPFIRQRFYRLGGTLTDNYYFTGVNASDGSPFLDTNTDAFALGTGLTAPVTHFQPVATVDDNGLTILAQPIRAIWGPLQGMLFGCGDPWRPGWLYASLPNQPDHWLNAIEVCEASTRLQNGCVWGDRAWVFSTERLFQIIPNLDSGGGLTSLPTNCQHGLASPWALTKSHAGIFFCAKDGIFVTDGGADTPISDDIWPIFDPHQVGPVYGYYPIDFTQPAAIQLTMVGTDVWFTYQDTAGQQMWMIYSTLYRQWRNYTFAFPVASAYVEEGLSPQSVLMGETTSGIVDFHSGLTDRGTWIFATVQTGALNQGAPRSDKRYGNLVLDLDTAGQGAYVQVFSNDASVPFPVLTTPGASGRQRNILDPFSGVSTRVQNLSLRVTVASPTSAPVLYLAELAYAMEPADYVLWETAEIDHGIPGWQTPLHMWLAARGTGVVVLTRTVYDDRFDVLLVDSYPISLTPVKSHIYVPFNAMKGALFGYRFTCAVPFRIYGNETTMQIQPFMGGPPVTLRPFDTTDPTGERATDYPLLAALRAGGTS